jgi:hypothetical protein
VLIDTLPVAGRRSDGGENPARWLMWLICFSGAPPLVVLLMAPVTVAGEHARCRSSISSAELAVDLCELGAGSRLYSGEFGDEIISAGFSDQSWQNQIDTLTVATVGDFSVTLRYFGVTFP